MNTRSPLLPPLPLAVVAGLLFAVFSARAQGPEDLPAPAEAPPPPPPADLLQMPIDVTPSPLDGRAQPPQGASPAQPAATTPPALQGRTPPPAPSATPPPNRYQRRPNANNANAAASPASTPGFVASAASPAPVSSPVPAGTGLRLNFQNASLIDVLNYLSAAAGFIITQETPVAGTVNVVSQQPVSIDEAVDLLSSLLAEKGYAVIRNGRILKIVALQDAPKRGDVPVYVGQEPKDIPRKDNMVTQIIPVRYAEVGKLVDNLRPLLSNSATISSNDSSNAIIITDTQTNIHRLAEIIHALDTSISGISQIKVFTLRYSDSKGLADVLTQLFSPQQRNNNQQIPGVPPQFQRFAQQQLAAAAANASPQSEARQAAARVVAVADEASNSVIVAAPDEVMSTVADVIAQLDTSTSDITETQIFRLQHADATELAAELTNLYADTGTAQAGNSNNNNRGGGNPFRGPQPPNNNNAGRSERALLQSRVVIVADARTNSVLVSASHDTMAQIGLTIGRLDANKDKKQHVYVYTLNHADPDNMATILRGMYSTTNANTNGNNSTQPSISALANRTQNGASSDVTSSLNTNGSSGRTNGR